MSDTFEMAVVFCLVMSAISLAFMAYVLVSIRGAIVECANQLIEGLRSIDKNMGPPQDPSKHDTSE
jgi:hypothetical protein